MPGKPTSLPYIKLSIVIMIFIFVFVNAIGIVRAEVFLDYFRASSQPDGILIEWETSSESNSSGFYILRSLSQDQDYTRINIFFLSDSEVGEGVFYSYLDETVVPGTIYYYKLEAIDLDGSSEFFGPVMVGYLIQTPTSTKTPTPNRTSTNLTNTPSPTLRIITLPPNSPTPSQTAIFTPGFNPTVITPTSTISGTVSTIPIETPTLEPLPTFELLFPASTATIAVTVTPTSQMVALVDNGKTENTSQPFSSRHVFLLVIIFLLWLALMGFLVLWIWKLFQGAQEIEADK